MAQKAENESLEAYLNARVFSHAQCSTLAPVASDVEGFNKYLQQYKSLLEVERKAVEVL